MKNFYPISSSISFPLRTAGLLFAGALLPFIPATSVACSICGCSLSSDWAAQGYAALPGADADVRFEYFRQSDLRSATGEANRATLLFPNDQEVQQETLNRSVWADLNYVVNSSWGFTAQLPYYDRFHSTIAAGDTAVSSSRADGLGDVRVLARFQKFAFSRSFSLQAGLKLPTGEFNQNFDLGPQAGTLLDRGLQLGTGTTDLLLGGSWFARPQASIGCFAQALLDQPLAQRAGFIPSTSVNFSAGARWLNSSFITPQLQVNARTENREHGPEADTANSGDTIVYLSPGATVELPRHASFFAFVQLPVYQRVNGLQLEPRWLFSCGLRFRL